MLLLLAGATSALGVQSTVYVRMEGKTQTLFEGPVRAEGHGIKAASDTQERQCDGTNAGAYPTPGPTPTAAAADALASIGESFDGTWSAGSADYFITRWGPDPQSAAAGEYWGVLVNGSFLSKGGCQFELAEGDQVLWVYNAFARRPFLTLNVAGAGATGGIPTATVGLGQPLRVQVEAYSAAEGAQHALGAYQGAEVSPLRTAPNGFETVEAGNATSATTGSDGSATLTFAVPGWHRLKATAGGAFRSNRLDVCVTAAGASSCGPAGPGGQGGGGSTTALGTGSAGAGGSSGAPSGDGATRGARGTLVLDGLRLHPLDDRAASIAYRGRWRRVRWPGAWDGTLTVGGARSAFTVRLAAGRPAVVLRDISDGCRVEVLAAGRHRAFALRGGAGARVLLGFRRAHAGRVTVRVLRGRVGVDAVAVA
jgi:hypothetical protein